MTFNPKPKIGMNANEVKFALHKLFVPECWLAVEELFIPDFNRYIDFWAICIAPPKIESPKFRFRYREVHAIEIKVSKQDFKSEMKNEDKRGPAQSFSNYFSFAAPKGIIDPDELPGEIGYIEFARSKPKFIKKPSYTYIETPSYEFICAIGRALREE